MVIVTTGLDQAKQFALDYFDKFSHMAIGSSTTPELVTQTTLGTEEVRDPLDLAIKDLGNGTYDFTARFELSDAAGDTITEAGIFDASTSGEMGIRKTLPVSVTKTGNQELEITIRVTVVASNGVI